MQNNLEDYPKYTVGHPDSIIKRNAPVWHIKNLFQMKLMTTN